MPHAKIPLLSEVEYLNSERKASVRHEYVAGQVFAMAGGTKGHNTIAGNVFAALKAHLRGRPCRTYIADMKVRVASAQSFYYPDVVVTCHPHDTTSGSPEDYLTAPCLIVEVLSSSTEAIDRREKRLAYLQLAGPLEYVLIDSRSRQVEIYRKDASGETRLEIPEAGEAVVFANVGLSLTFDEIYEDSGVFR